MGHTLGSGCVKGRGRGLAENSGLHIVLVGLAIWEGYYRVIANPSLVHMHKGYPELIAKVMNTVKYGISYS